MRIHSIMPKVAFGAHFTNVDIGASSINGSMKIASYDEAGNLFKKERTTVFNEGEKRCEDTFERNVAQKINEFEENNSDIISEKDPENKAKVAICYPGPMIKTKDDKNGFFVSNFFYDDRRHNRFERPILPENIDKNLNENVVQTRHVNDMAGAGACILDKVEKQYPNVAEAGTEAIFLYPGGGLGSGVLMFDDDNTKIKPTEIQHMEDNTKDNPQRARDKDHKRDSVEHSASAPGIMNAYAAALNKYSKVIINPDMLENNVKIVTDESVAKQYLPKISDDSFKYLSFFAINSYMHAIGQVIATQICATKTNNIILAGNIANGIRKAVNENPEFEEYKNEGDDKFSANLRNVVQGHLTTVGESILGDIKNLNIYFVDINDNTEGLHLLQNSTPVGNPVKWYNVKK